MRQQWIPLFLYISTILLLTCLFVAEAEESYDTPQKKRAWLDNHAKEFEDAKTKYDEKQEAKKIMKYLYYGAIGGGSVSAILNGIFFILACKGVICKPKQAKRPRTQDE